MSARHARLTSTAVVTAPSDLLLILLQIPIYLRHFPQEKQPGCTSQAQVGRLINSTYHLESTTKINVTLQSINSKVLNRYAG